MNSSNDQKTSRKTLVIIIILLLITLIAVGVSIWSLFLRGPGIILTPDYAPVEEEKNAEDIGDGNDEKLEHSEGGGAAGVAYSSSVTVDLSEEKASLLFQNPSRSTCDMVVQIVIRDTVIAQSGRLVPGKMIRTLDLLDGASDMLSEGGYDAALTVLFYNTETGEKFVVNTVLKVTLTAVQ